MKAVLIGNYGVGNFGDEALKEYFLGAFPEVSWTVLSAHPKRGELPRLPFGLRSFLTKPWWRTIAAIRGSDAVVFGGGTLFTDVESVRACLLWGFHAWVARLFHAPVFLAFQGVGPFRTRLGEGIARRVFSSAHFVSVRDEASLARVRGWGGDRAIVQTFDPILLAFRTAKSESDTKNVFIVIPRMNSGEKLLAAVADIPRTAGVRILLFQPSREQGIALKLRLRFPRAEILSATTVAGLMHHLAGALHCISERFHGVLAAVAAGVPLTVISQAPGDKLALAGRLQDHAAIDEAVRLAEAGEQALREALRDC